MRPLVQRFLRPFHSSQPTQHAPGNKPRRRHIRLAVEPLEERVLLSLAVLPNQPLPAGTSPLDVQLGHIDSDNTVDLAALGTDGQLTVALNNGDNFWRSNQTTDLGVGPSNGLALGLFGPDPFLDAVVQGPNTVTLARGDGTGQFTVAQTLTPGTPGTLAPTGGGPLQLATALLNGDPFTDLVTVAPGTNEVLVFLGNAAGTLGTPARYPSGASQPIAVAVGDFVGDTLPDLAIGHRDGSVTFRQGLPGGTFLPRPDLTVPGLGAVTGLATGNFDGTGTELAVSSANGVTLLKNSHHLVALSDPVANGDFSAGLSGWTASGPVTAAGHFAQLQENTAGLTTTLQQTFVVPPQPQTLSFDLVALGLENGAGLPDAFEASLLDSQQNALVPTFRPEATSFFNANPGGVFATAPGVTFDGRRVSVDVHALTPGSQTTLVFDLIGNPPGATSVASVGNLQVSQTPIAEAFTTVALAGPFGSPAAIATGDVDGDGHADLVVADSGLNQLLVYNGDDTGNFTRSTFNTASFGAGAAAIAAAPLTAGASHDDVAVALVGSGRVLTPLVLDTTPPQATLVSPAPDQMLNADVSALRVQFSEALRDAGVTGTHSVTNPASYTLLNTTANQPLPLAALAYDPTTHQVVLTLAAAVSPLPAAAYRLTINGTDAANALQDLAANPLAGGHDVVASFTLVTAAPPVTVTPGPNILWPPNHELVDVHITLDVADAGDPNPTVTLVAITANEPLSPDDIQNAAFGSDDRDVTLRRERLGTDTGRVYTLTYFVRDADGNSRLASAFVVVTHDEAQGVALLAALGNATAPGLDSLQTSTISNVENGSFTVGDVVSDSIAQAGEVDVWSFSGSAGQQLFGNAQAGSATALHWALADPQRQILFSGDFRDRDTLTLPSTGTYYLTVDGRNGATGAYQFQVWNVPAGTNTALTLDEPVSGTLAVPGQRDRYTVSGSAGQAVFLDVLDSAGGLLSFTLRGPSGTTLLTANNANQNNGVTLPTGGTYTVAVGHGSTLAATGGYRFQLDSVPADIVQAIALNTPVSGSLTVPGQTQSYTFRGNLGEQLALHVTANPSSFALFTLRDPSGNVLFANQASDTSVASLPASGSYTLTVSGNGDAVGSFAFQVEDQTATVVVPVAPPLPPSGITTTNLSGNPVGPFDFAHLQDITPLGLLAYTGTTFNRHTHTLYASVQLTDVAPVALGHTVLLVFDRFTPPAVRPAVADGFHPDGRPFVAFTSQLGPLGLQPGATSAALQLSFADPTGDRFAFDGTLLAPGNVAPVFTSTPPAQATSDTTYAYVPTVSDANGDALTFRLTVAPAGLTVDPQTGVLSWTPTASQAGSNNVTLVADDGRGGLATQSFAVQVLPGPANHNPSIVTTPATTTVLPGQTSTYVAQALDPDGDPLSWALLTAPAGASLDATTGRFTWTPAPTDLGPHTVTLRVSDDRGGADVQTFVVTVPSAASAELHGTVFDDRNGNGVQDPGTLPPVPFDADAQFSASDNPNGVWTYAYETALGNEATFTLDQAQPTPPGIISWGGHTGTLDYNPGLYHNSSNQAVTIGTAFWGPHETILHPGPHGESSLLRFTAPADGSYTLNVTFVARDSSPGGTDVHVLRDGVSLFDGAVGFHQDASYQATLALTTGEHIDFAVGVGGDGTFYYDSTGVHAVVTESVATLLEPGLPGWVVYLDQNQNGQRDVGEPFTTTDADGHYAFTTLAPGSYRVAEALPSGWVQTAPAAQVFTPSLTAGQVQTGLAFGNRSTANLGGNQAPVFATTPPSSVAVGQLFAYAARANDPDGDAVTYDLLSGPAGLVVQGSTGQVFWVPTADEVGSQSVVLRATDSRGAATLQPFTVTVTPPGPDTVITSTPLLLATVNQPYRYTVTAVTPPGQPSLFTLLDGPAGMSLDPASGLLAWTPGPADLGLHAIVVEAGDPGLQTYLLDVRPPNTPPTVTSTPVTSVVAGALYRYRVVAADPSDAVTFSLAAGPAAMTLDAASGRLLWQPGTADVGPHAVDVRVTDERGAVTDQTFTLTVAPDLQPPSISLIYSSNLADPGDTVTLVVLASDNVAVASRALTINGVAQTLDASGATTFTPTTPGLYTLVGTATDPSGNSASDTAVLRVFDPSDVTPPSAEITSPLYGDTVTYLTPVTGTVTDPNLEFYTLEYAPSGSNQWTTFAQGTSNVVNSTLGTFDPTLLANGPYDLRLMAQDIDGHRTYRQLAVNVSAQAKLGNFHQEYTDLSVPLTGIPITVTRVYDTLDANRSGDFGFGWHLAAADPRIHETVPQIADEQDNPFGVAGFRAGTKVYLTGPDGKRVGFTFDPVPEGGLLGTVWHPHFRPDPGVFSQLSVDDVALSQRGDGAFGLYLIGFAYNPSAYTLTTTDGLAYRYGQFTGLETITDRNGNVLTFTRGGIFSSAGPSVQFVRDGLGRISRVVDPAGNAITYGYDDHGDLTAMTNQADLMSHYGYLQSPAHYLQDLNATGDCNCASAGPPLQAAYDAGGRLDALGDALGDTAHYAFDLAQFTETVTDPLGHATTLVYDARGNIVSRTDPVGATWQYSFDANDNQLSLTDPRGYTTHQTFDDRGNVLSVTDALGSVSHFAYTTRNDLSTAADPLGRMLQYAYDDRGNLVLFTNAAGGTESWTYDAAGNALTVTDPNGHTIGFAYANGSSSIGNSNPDGSNSSAEYNTFGEPTRAVDENGHETLFAYDEAGRLLSIRDAEGHVSSLTYQDDHIIALTDALSRTTHYEYDAAGRRVRQIDATGGVTLWAYDADNHVVAQTDPTGLTTQFTYDPAGHLVAVANGTTTQHAYDLSGNRIAETDPNGHTTHYAYDGLNRLIQQTDALGGTESFSYDAVGNLLSDTDANGHTTAYVYDNLNRRIRVTDALGGVWAWSYDGVGHLLSTTDPNGHTTLDAYDSRNRLLVQTDAAGGTTHYSYDAYGNRLSTTDPLGHVTQWAYDVVNRVMSMTDAAGGVVAYGYDATGNLTSRTDQLGHTTQWAYDALNRVLTTTDAAGGVSSDAYDAVGDRTAATDANGHTVAYAYDPLHRLASVTDAAGGVTHYTHDPAGNLLSASDPLGQTTQFAYDALNRLVRTTDAAGGVEQSTYDPVGNTLTTTDAIGRTTQYSYDALNRLIVTTDPAGGVSQQTYDAAGNRTSVTDPGGQATHFVYDTLNRLVQQTDPTGFAASYAYDANGNLTQSIDRDGRLRTFSHDVLDRRVGEAWWTGSTPLRQIQYTYDAVGNLVSATDPDSSYTFGYDTLDRVTSADNAGTPVLPHVVLPYAYDAAGNVLSVGDNSGVQVTSTYDVRDQLASRTWSGPGLPSAVVNFGYDARGAVAQIDRWQLVYGPLAGVHSSFAYDVVGRLLSLTHTADIGGLVADYQSTYDAASQLVSESHHGQAYTYQYDSRGQLTAANPNGQPNTSYAYDANGNRTGTGVVVGGDNRLQSDGIFQYAYDGEGNLIGKVEIATGVVTTYSYDYRNRLIAVEQRDGNGTLLHEEQFAYDVFDRRIVQDVDGVVTATVYNGQDAWADYNAAGEVVARYLHGDRIDQLLARFRPSEGLVWYVADHQGTVRDLVGPTGALRDHLDYDAFGTVVLETNPGWGDRFRFTGREYDALTGLYYYRARWYDPRSGRFLSQDPLGFAAGDLNLYRYVGNHPLTATDPSGLTAAKEEETLLGQFTRFVTTTKLGCILAATLVSMAVRSVFQVSAAAGGQAPEPLWNPNPAPGEANQTVVNVGLDVLTAVVACSLPLGGGGVAVAGGGVLAFPLARSLAFSASVSVGMNTLRPLINFTQKASQQGGNSTQKPKLPVNVKKEGGRITEVSATLDKQYLGTGTEPSKAMRKELVAMGAEVGDDRGHLIAEALGGKGGKKADNIVPMAENLNSTLGAFERAIKAEVDKGIPVQVKVLLKYNRGNTTKRPDYITYEINGGSKAGTYGPFPNQ